MNRRKNGWRKDLGSARHVVSAGISAAWATNMVLAGLIKLDILGVGSALDSCPEFIRVKSRLDPFPGEFFTPVSLVQMIVNVIEPDHGKVLDPACGSGGMFVQSAHFIESMHEIPQERVTFYGQEKNPTTIRLAKLNLEVHGLEGNIQKGITYYEDHHEMLGKADFVMANPPFNVDEVDAGKVKNDPRLPRPPAPVGMKQKCGARLSRPAMWM